MCSNTRRTIASDFSDFNGSASVDSLNVSIPLSSLEILDSTFASKITHSSATLRSLLLTEDGEVLEDSLVKPRDKGGIKSTFARILPCPLTGRSLEVFKTHYKFQPACSGRIGSILPDSINFTLHSKMLGSRYFEGLTPDTLRLAYDEIISQGVISFSFEALLSAYAHDVDVKTDYQVDDFDSYTRQCRASCLEHVKQAKLWKSHFVVRDGRRVSTGFQVSERGSRRNLYLKLYDKAIMLNELDSQFRDVFLSDVSYPNGRVEVNFPNARSLRDFGILVGTTSLTLSNILTGVCSNGIQALSKVQFLYMRFPMFTTPKQDDISNIRGKAPAARTLRRWDSYLTKYCFVKGGDSCDKALGVLKLFSHKDYAVYLRNHILFRFYQWSGDVSYLSRVTYKKS